MPPDSFFLAPLLIALPLFASISSAQTVSSTILCFAPDEASSYSITSGLNAYGIPYELYIVPSTGITLPILNSSATSGNYGGFITLSELSYSYADGWGSALTDDQWQQMYDYQTTFGVRMTRLDVYPDSDFGTYCPKIFSTKNNTNEEQVSQRLSPVLAAVILPNNLSVFLTQPLFQLQVFKRGSGLQYI
jgi:hypothetical protein